MDKVKVEADPEVEKLYMETERSLKPIVDKLHGELNEPGTHISEVREAIEVIILDSFHSVMQRTFEAK